MGQWEVEEGERRGEGRRGVTEGKGKEGAGRSEKKREEVRHWKLQKSHNSFPVSQGEVRNPNLKEGEGEVDWGERRKNKSSH